MQDGAMMIAFSEASYAIKDTESLDDKVTKAMEVTANHWMCVDESTQFQAALAALLQAYPEGTEERERLAVEVDAIKKMNAIMQAGQAGLSVDIHELDIPPKDFKPIDLIKRWREIKHPKAAHLIA